MGGYHSMDSDNSVVYIARKEQTKMNSNDNKDLAREVYKRVFGAMAGSPSWCIKAEEWLFMPEPLEKLTRDEAFKGICKRSRL